MKAFVNAMIMLLTTLAMPDQAATGESYHIAMKSTLGARFQDCSRANRTRLEPVAQQKAITQPSVSEPKKFWTMIANDERLDKWVRGTAIYMLFERHVKKDTTLVQMARLLDNPRWIRDKDVSVVRVLGGWVPLKHSAEDTLFEIVVFPTDDVDKHHKECLAIYIVLSGQLDENAFLSVVQNRKGQNGESKIKAWAFIPTWEEHVKRGPSDGR